MFLADDEINELYTKGIANNDPKSYNVTSTKRPVCRFFIPKVGAIFKRIEDKTMEWLGRENPNRQGDCITDINLSFDKKPDGKNDSSINVLNKSPSNNQKSSAKDNLLTKKDYKDNSNLKSTLNLISQPMCYSQFFEPDEIKTEAECPPRVDACSSPTDSYCSLPPMHSPNASKCNSDIFPADDDYSSSSLAIKDYYSLKVKSPQNIFDIINTDKSIGIHKNIPLHVQKSTGSPSIGTMTSSCCSIFHSSIKLEPDITFCNKLTASCDEFRPYRSFGSPPCPVRTLHVDIDKDSSRQIKIPNMMQPIVLVERLRSDKLRKRKAQVMPKESCSIVSSKSDSKRSRRSKVSKSDLPKGPSKRVKRIKDSDEETELAEDDEVMSVPYPKNFFESESRSILPLRTKNCSIESDMIICFQCDTESRNICSKHPVAKIRNLNIVCPYIEYLIDTSSSDYVNDIKEIQDCFCKQNELDHIQQSLPVQFHLRESRISEIGVWTISGVRRGSLLGPYLGEIVENLPNSELNTNRYKTRGTSKSDYFSPCIEFAFKSNWLRCINFSANQFAANLKVVHYQKKVFFQAIRKIGPNKELLVFNKPEPNIKADEINERDPKSVNDGLYSLKPIETDYINLSDTDIENIHFNGTKYSKEMIIDIAKIWRKYPQMTISQTLEIIVEKYPESKGMSEGYLSRLTRRYQLRSRGGIHNKLDSQMTEALRMWLLQCPYMTAPIINRRLKEQFPLNNSITDSHLDFIISQQRLRPSTDIHKTVISKNIDKPTNGEKNTRKKAPSVTQKDSIVPDSNPSLPNCVPVVGGEESIVERIRRIHQQDPFKHADQILNDLKRQFPCDKFVDIETVKKLMKDNGITTNYHFTKKIDDEMRGVICRLRIENPTFSVTAINRHLRNLLPHKPFVQPKAVCHTLRKYHLAAAK